MPDEEIHYYSGASKPYHGIDGRGIELRWGTKGLKRMPNVGTPECFEATYRQSMREAERRSKFKSQRGMNQHLRWAERAKANIEPARAFWAEIDRLTEASGIKEAEARKEAAQEALAKHVAAIMEAEARNTAGLVIKVQAMEAWAEVDHFRRLTNLDGYKWADAMSASIFRVHRTA